MKDPRNVWKRKPWEAGICSWWVQDKSDKGKNCFVIELQTLKDCYDTHKTHGMHKRDEKEDSFMLLDVPET